MKKYLLNLSLIVTLLAYSPTIAQAKTFTTLDTLDSTPINKISDENYAVLESEINAMSDKEFDDYITSFVSNQSDRTTAVNKLSKLGVELDFNTTNNDFSVSSISPSYLTLSTYSAHRGQDTYYRLYESFTWNGYSESRPATYDVLGIYFNKNKADYYGYNCSDSSKIWLKDSSQFLNGTILFSVDDNQFNIFSDTYYAAVYVTPSVTGGSLVYGGKYVHTYNTTSTSTSGSASVSFSGTGVTGSIGFSVNTSTLEASWEKSDDNTILSW